MGPHHPSSKKVLIRRLCLANVGEEITDEDLLMYADLFSRPMTDSQIAVVLALFGWDPSILPTHMDLMEVEAGH